MNTVRDISQKRTRFRVSLVVMIFVVVLVNILMKIYIVLTTKPGII